MSNSLLTPPILDILNDTACRHSVLISDMKGPSRLSELIVARREFARVAKHHGYGQSVIARAINRRRPTISNYLK